MRQFGDRVARYAQIFGEHVGGEAEHVAAGGQQGVVPVSAVRRQQSTPDRGRRIGRVIAKAHRGHRGCRRRRRRIGQTAAGLQVQHVLSGRRRPVGHLAPALTGDVERGLCRVAMRPGDRQRWVSSQSCDSPAMVRRPCKSNWVCVHGPIVSATSTPRSRRWRYCSSDCCRNRSCQPPISSTGTCTRSSAAPNRIDSQNGSLSSGCSSHDSHHGAPVPSSSRPAAPSGNSPAARMTFFCARSWRMPERIRPGSSWWATRWLQPRKSLTVNEPVPQADVAEIMRAGGDDGRGQLRRRILQQRPLGEPQIGNPDGGEAAGEPGLLSQPCDGVGAVGCFVDHRLEGPARAERPPHTLQQHAVAAGGVQRRRTSARTETRGHTVRGPAGCRPVRVRRARSGRPPVRRRRASGSRPG